MVRRKPLVVWVVVIFALLIGNSLWLRGGALERSFHAAWSLTLVGVQALVRTQVVAGEGALLVAISPRGVALVGDDGKERRSYMPRAGIAAGATGDVTGDGIDDIVVASAERGTLALTLLDGRLKPLWSAAVEEAALPQRVLVVNLDEDGRRDVVVACAGGAVHALSSRGQALWHWSMASGPVGEDADVRGLDDLKAASQRLVALGRRDGLVALLDGRGQPAWTHELPSKLRRLRALELGAERDSTLLVGTEDGVCRRLRQQGARGQAAVRAFDVLEQLGEPVTEIRTADVDGDAKTRELLLGGKNGRVVIVGSGAGNVAGKVSALAGVDLDGDGRDEVLAGTEGGDVYALNAAGAELGSWHAGGKVDALVGIPGNAGQRLVVVAAGKGVEAYRYGERIPPAWYRPASAGVLGTLALGVVALVLARLKPLDVAPPPPRPDGRAARRIKLEEALQRVASLAEQGAARGMDASERSEQLREQLAALERAVPGAAPVALSPPPPRKRQ